ncbi:hypothetical protein AB0A95_16545 [Micromonospora sp. NPDC049230]|uniref:hypothetical protein n=1 Tax=Micromonospora sp. NPDC049230 TaxID=3155502 RepID=UPI003410E100
MLLSQHAVAALTDAFKLGLDPQPAAYAERFLGWVLDRARKDVEKNGYTSVSRSPSGGSYRRA